MSESDVRDEESYYADGYLEVWGFGREDSLRILLSRMSDSVRETYGTNAIHIFSKNHINVTINDVWLNIRCEPDQFWISALPQFEQYDVLSWNQALTELHSKIIEP